ncbi:uncharacterized protein LOC127853616 isoform X1 [Dreissena polymorpha]|uniref:uncharacterized protein LOC127853616 isoform X1 n=1 Tax=Dreissena polymorpha TaxID=45954 RepID=UPI0022649D80|nr:uncharacterized protein LOC127853616 isoform X1 [Dreissena polymorpha]
MSDSGTGIDHVDQGTIVMLTLTFVLGISVSFWFACNWYVKKRRKEAKDVTPSASEVPVEKTRVKQTFSRFSQVDEEVADLSIRAVWIGDFLSAYDIRSIFAWRWSYIHLRKLNRPNVHNDDGY